MKTEAPHIDLPQDWKEVLAPVSARLAELQQPKAVRWLHYATFPAMQIGGTLVVLWATAQDPGSMIRMGAFVIGWILIALAMNGYFLLIHEAIHGLLVRSRLGNQVLGILLACQGLVSATSYKVVHMRHHNFLGHDEDPDDYRNYSKDDRIVWLLQINRLIWATFIYVVVLPFMSWRHASTEERRSILLEYLIVGAVAWVALMLVPLWTLVLCWGIPLLMANLMINIRGLSQHGSTDSSHPFTASRTVLPNRLLRFLMINENFHLEHHLYPSVPADRLPDLHEELSKVLPVRVTHPGYVSYLWDFFRSGPTGAAESLGVEVGSNGK